MSEELPREEGLPEESEESERWISNLFSALPEGRPNLRAREREVRRNEDYDAEAAERHNEVYRTVLCCLVLCIFCCMVVAFAALAFGLFGPGALVWIL